MKTILLIEDDKDLREILIDVIDILKLSVIPISSLEEALLYVKHNPPPNIVVLDLFLNGLPAIPLIQKINKKWPKTKLIITSVSKIEDYVKPYQYDFFLKKPFDFETLENIIATRQKNVLTQNKVNDIPLTR